MKIVNNLVFKGNCREAFERYATLLEGTVKLMISFGDVPQEAAFAGEFKDMIMHAWLDIGDQAIMGCDAPPQYQQQMGGFSIALHTDDPAEARRTFDDLAEGGSASMPFGPTFWSPAFGMLTDRFGTPWTINTVPPEGWMPAKP